LKQNVIRKTEDKYVVKFSNWIQT